MAGIFLLFSGSGWWKGPRECTDIISFSIYKTGGDIFNRDGKLGELNFLNPVLSARNVNYYYIVIIELSLDDLFFIILYRKLSLSYRNKYEIYISRLIEETKLSFPVASNTYNDEISLEILRWPDPSSREGGRLSLEARR